MLEPMLEGTDTGRTMAVGSTWLSLALDSGAEQTPPIGPAEFLPPALAVNRPCYDGDPATIGRMMADITDFFRATKSIIRDSIW